jgi:hypothetical protein
MITRSEAASRVRRVWPTLAPSEHCSDSSYASPIDSAALTMPARGRKVEAAACVLDIQQRRPSL